MLTGPVPYGGFHAVQTFLCTGIGKDTGTTPKGRIPSQRGPATTAAGGQAPAVSLSQPQCYPGPHHLSHIIWLWWSAPIEA